MATRSAVHRKGHYGVALLAYAPVALVLLALELQALATVGGAVVVGGAMLPDLDQRIPGVKHRGPTHTVWFALAVGVVLGVLGAVAGWQHGGAVVAAGGGVFGLFVGTLTVLAHLLADVLTPTGIRPLAPVEDTTYSLDVVTAGNPIANYALLGVGAVALGLAAAGGLAI